MEKELNGKPGVIKYVWENGSEYASDGTIYFGAAGVFLKDSTDESFQGQTIFFPYSRIITISF